MFKLYPRHECSFRDVRLRFSLLYFRLYLLAPAGGRLSTVALLSFPEGHLNFFVDVDSPNGGAKPGLQACRPRKSACHLSGPPVRLAESPRLKQEAPHAGG